MSWLWRDDDEENYEEDEDYKAALAFYREFQSKPDVDYAIAIAYAQQLHERCEATDKALDEKADSIIKYLGGGTAIVGIGSLAALKTDSLMTLTLGIVLMCCLIPSLVAAIYAVTSAVKVRRARAAGSLPHVQFAVQMAEFHKTEPQIKLNLWLIYHPICEAAHFRNKQKAKLVNRAHKCYEWAIKLLLIPVFGAVGTLISMLPK